MPFAPSLARWNLVPDGEPIHTHSSDLLPVRTQGQPAMLKVARSDEEERGHRLMVWWGGEGAARVYAHAGEALLMERVPGGEDLGRWALTGRDDGASRVLCAVAAELHRPRPGPLPQLTGLDRWFRALDEAAALHGGPYADGWALARRLLNAPQDVRPLHGDLHHANVLHSPERGWLAIDPKGLIGERAFDFANILCNPTLDHARTPGRLGEQVAVVADAAGLDPARLLHWVAAYAALSAAWHLGDGETETADATLEVMRIARAERGR